MPLQILLRSAATNSFATSGLDAEERTKFPLSSSLESLGWIGGTAADSIAVTDDADVAHGVDYRLSFLIVLTDFCIFAAGQIAGRHRAFRARIAVEARRAAELSLLARTLTHFGICARGPVAGIDATCWAMAAFKARRASELAFGEVGLG